MRYDRFDFDLEVRQVHLLAALLLYHLQEPRVIPVHDAGKLELVHAREQNVSFLWLHFYGWLKKELLWFFRRLSEVTQVKV